MPGDRPTEDTVFVVSGGAKGITAECVIRLAERYRSRFILVGRSIYHSQPDPAWAEGEADEAALKRAALDHLKTTGERPTPRMVQKLVKGVQTQREIRATLQAVSEKGGQAIYVSADVTDPDALATAVTEGARQLGDVTGIIHGAGVLADKLIQHKTVDDFDRVLSVKVSGLRNLISLVPLGQLDYFILFSSVAGFYGNAAQADYAVANEILNKAAYWAKRRNPQCRVMALDWGPWDGGMVTPELKRQLAARDINVIPVEAGTEILADLMTAPSDATQDGVPQMVVGDALLPPLHTPVESERNLHLHRRLTLEANPFLRDHVIGGHAVLPTVCAISWMATTCEQLYPGYYLHAVDDYRVLKGIVFDEELVDDYVLDLTLDGECAEDKICAEALIRSETREGKPRYHYSASVVLSRTASPGPARAPVALAGSAVLKGDELYESRVLFHGPAFRGIREILEMDDTGLVMRCRLPHVPWATQGQFQVHTFNPYVVDAQLQSLLVWSHTYLGSAGLPLRIQRGVQYRPLAFDTDTFVTMRVASVGPRSLVADVTVQDPEGVVCMEVYGAQITLSERLGELFQQNALDDEKLIEVSG